MNNWTLLPGQPEKWLDTASNLLWHIPTNNRMCYDAAIAQFGNTIPTVEQFKDARIRGILNVLNLRNGIYWLKDLDHLDNRFAYVFHGEDNSVCSIYPRISRLQKVICVESVEK